MADAQAEASQALAALNDYIEANMSFIESAIDGTTAGNLQNQITALQQQLDDFDLSGSVDNETIEYTPAAGSAQDKLRVMLQETRAAMGLGDTLGVLPVSSGGTGVTAVNDWIDLVGCPVPAIMEISDSAWVASPENGESISNFRALLVGVFSKTDYSGIAIASLEASVLRGVSISNEKGSYSAAGAFFNITISDNKATFYTTHITPKNSAGSYGLFLR